MRITLNAKNIGRSRHLLHTHFSATIFLSGHHCFHSLSNVMFSSIFHVINVFFHEHSTFGFQFKSFDRNFLLQHFSLTSVFFRSFSSLKFLSSIFRLQIFFDAHFFHPLSCLKFLTLVFQLHFFFTYTHFVFHTILLLFFNSLLQRG